MKNDFTRHGNRAKTDPQAPKQINGRFAPNIITANVTGAGGFVTNYSEENAAIAKNEVDDIRL